MPLDEFPLKERGGVSAPAELVQPARPHKGGGPPELVLATDHL